MLLSDATSLRGSPADAGESVRMCLLLTVRNKSGSLPPSVTLREERGPATADLCLQMALRLTQAVPPLRPEFLHVVHQREQPRNLYFFKGP